MTIQPRDYQLEAKAAVFDFFCNTRDRNPVVVIPTGGGKTLVAALICKEAVQEYKGRVVVLQHTKELIEQNAEGIHEFFPEADIGIYSAGLNARDTESTILCAGIQSIYSRAHLVGSRQLVIIDECHLLSPNSESMYQTFISDLRKYCPNFRIMGMTASPYRTGEGPICTPEGILNKIVYSASIRKLISDNHLCNLTTKSADATVDTSGLRVQAGEFVSYEMDQLFDDEAKINAACHEIIARTKDRHSVLIFCSGVHHAEQVANRLMVLTGELVGVVTGKTSPLVRAGTLSNFKEVGIKYLTNCSVLTTGFNAKNIDCVVVLRATMSPGLFYQMTGRGLRVHESKPNGCLVLDFGENIQRHGPIDDPEFGRRGKAHGEVTGEAPVKKCPGCGQESSIAATQCLSCGLLFPGRELKHGTTPEEQAELLANTKPQTWLVGSVRASRHTKKRKPDEEPKPDTLRIDYDCTLEGVAGNLVDETISEWVCVLHGPGYARKKAEGWWAQHTKAPFGNIDEALAWIDAGAFGWPTRIVTTRDGHFFRITSREIAEIPDLPGDAFEGASAPVTVNDEWAMDEATPF